MGSDSLFIIDNTDNIEITFPIAHEKKRESTLEEQI